MSYRGNFYFDDDEMMDEGVCQCCGDAYSMVTCAYDDDRGMYYDKPFTPRYDDGEPIIAEYDHYDYVANCKCDAKDLREKYEEYGYILLDSYGHKLFERLREIDGLRDINEFDICRLSEVAQKSFKDLCEWFDHNLVLAHVYAWSKHMKQKWG